MSTTTDIVLTATFGILASVVSFEVLKLAKWSMKVRFVVSGIIGSVVSGLLYYFVFNSNNNTTTCTSNSDCSGNTPICNTTTGTCVQCLENNDCPAGQICQNNECVVGTACSSNSDCSGSTPYCDTTTGTCVQCIENSDCSSGQACSNNVCTACDSSCYGSYGCGGGAICCGLTNSAGLCYADNSSKTSGDTLYTFEPIWFTSTDYSNFLGFINPSSSGPWLWKQTGMNGLVSISACGSETCNTVSRNSWNSGWLSQIILVDKDNPTSYRPVEFGKEYWLYDVLKNAFLYYALDTNGKQTSTYAFYPGNFSTQGIDGTTGYSYISMKLNYEGSGSTPQYVTYEGPSLSFDDTSLTFHQSLYTMNTQCCDNDYCTDENDPCLSSCFVISNNSGGCDTYYPNDPCQGKGKLSPSKITVYVQPPSNEFICSNTLPSYV